MSHLHVPLNARRWTAVRRAAFERDGWRCVECGKAGRLEADHIVPLKRGGDPWDPANLQSLCRGVNGGAKRDHLGGVRRDRLAAAGLSP